MGLELSPASIIKAIGALFRKWLALNHHILDLFLALLT